MKPGLNILISVILMSTLISCEDFLHPEQDLVLDKNDVPHDLSELYATTLGLYAIQQELVEQIVVLGELRGDLLEITKHANPDLREVYNFQISSNNKYASPKNFYKLIAASNKLIRIVEDKYLSQLDSLSGITDYHKILGEAICMRSWAYFNAARIYNEIPYIPETLNDIEKIVEYINSPKTYVDSFYIQYAPDGLNNDTIVKVYEPESKMVLEQGAIIRLCIKDIENRVISSGVDYGRESGDETWEATVWNNYARYTLLGHMYLNIGDYTKAMHYFNRILNHPVKKDESIRFGLDNRFSYDDWKEILLTIDKNEHIFTLWFGRTSQTFQINPLQYYFSSKAPNLYAMKPTKYAVDLWETLWNDYNLGIVEQNPSQTKMILTGTPGDYHRGNGKSFAYIKNGVELTNDEWAKIMELKQFDKPNELRDFVEGVDTVVYKYSFDKGIFSRDANFMIYRAAGVHLYASEIYSSWIYMQGGLPRQFLYKAEEYIYTGNYKDNSRQLGVSGRVGFDKTLGISVDDDVVYTFNPYTNEVTGYHVFSSILEKQLYLEEVILKERARELAFEGERYYDILRIAKRRNSNGQDGTAFLADKIASKFKGSEKESMRARLMNENNWYVPFNLN